MSRKYVGLAIAVGLVVLTSLVWSRLPDSIPIHWNIRGEVDGWARKWPGAFFVSGLAFVLWLLFLVLPRIDPRRSNYERFEPTYWLVANVAIGFMAVIHVLTLATALGWAVDVTRVIMLGLGLLLIALGNYLPRIKPNWWMGIRTPWTLDNDKVWRDTHRISGKTFVAAGLVTLAAALFSPQWGFVLMLVSLGVAAVFSIVYSYLAWRREQQRV